LKQFYKEETHLNDKNKKRREKRREEKRRDNNNNVYLIKIMLN